MIDGSEKCNGWLNFERQSPHVIERRRKGIVYTITAKKAAIMEQFRFQGQLVPYSSSIKPIVDNIYKTKIVTI